MIRSVSTLFVGAVLAGSASAAVVLNSDFEGNTLDEWTVAITGAEGGVATNTVTNGFNTGADSFVYDGNDVADLGDYIAFANTTTTRTVVSFTTDVFEDDETTAQLISEGDVLSLTLAIGNRSASSGNFSRGADASFTVGYLTTPGDDTTFVGLQSLDLTQFDIYGPTSPLFVEDNTFADFSVSTTIAAGSAAIGQQFAVQVLFDQAGQSQSRQSVFDNVRVDVVPEPSSVTLLGLGFFGLLIRRRR
ncbi:MAG: PEP-CTERM sorting domain-containing protein [Verrucomicrobiales bacterium]|nr:PEP-CTERM sorting domain-containing protein [Verrucomicrobiota bacterium JB025]